MVFAVPEASAAAPTGLTVEHQAKPLAVESAAPLLGWQLRDGNQTAYDVEGDFKVTTVAAGIKFRVNNTNNSFYWQIRGDSSNELRPHVQVNGTYTQLKAVKLPMTIGLNVQHHIRIHAEGSTITTFID